MAQQPASAPTPIRAANAASQAFGSAAEFIDKLGILAWHARRHQRDAAHPDAWKRHAGTYAAAFIAWHDLSKLLTPTIREAARRVYPPGAPSIRIGRLRAQPTVIEVVADELGVFLRNVLYQDRESPLDAEGVKRWRDAFMLMTSEWEAQDPTRAESRLELLKCGSIDFDDLRTQLDREALAVIPPEDDLIDGTKPANDKATDSDEAPPALTPNQTLVIGTMAQFDGSRLLSAATIDAKMDPKRRLSERTIGPIVRRLIELELAERPEGKRSGARLTTKGRRLAPKIAD